MSNKKIIGIGIVIVLMYFTILISNEYVIFSANNSKTILVKEPTKKPTPTKTKEVKTVKPTSTKKYYNAERYSLLMDENLINFREKPIEETISYINTTFKDDLKLIETKTIESKKNNYHIYKYESKDKSILLLYSEKNFCIAYDWERGQNKQN
ncbi:MAG: hypothetical protein PVJ67_05170 [Candidatus Pacearchaeota archaeon]|jgi:hypothetical protein